MNDTQTKQDEVEIYSSGVCCCSVCAPKDMPLEEVESIVNMKNPSGIQPWKKSSDKTFHGGEPNPCPCGANPETRVHYLLNC